MFDNIGEVFASMIRIPTVSGKGNEEFYHIKEYRENLKVCFPKLFASVQEIPVDEALILKLEGQDTTLMPVLFTGHMDVVPVDPSRWKFPPFSGHTEDGVVWGRGTQDMKGPQCALLSALNDLCAEGWKPNRTVWLYLSCDEEVGGMTTEKAAQWFLAQGIRFEAVFDEGGTISENFMGLVDGRAAVIAISEKGSLTYTFTAEGAGGHAMNAPKNSAIARIADMVSEIEHQDIFVRQMTAGNEKMLRTMAEITADPVLKEKMLTAAEEGGDHPVLHELCPGADGMLGGTIAFTIINGGSAFNVMPREVKLTANVRVSSVEKECSVTEKLKAIAAKHDIICELTDGSDASFETDTDSWGYQIMKQGVQDVYPGLPVIPFVLGGGTDSKHFQLLTDVIVRFSPMHADPWQGAGVHGDNEAANIEDVRMAAICYRNLFAKYM